MQDTSTATIEEVFVEKSEVRLPEKELDWFSGLKPIQLDWSLEERVKLVEMALETNPKPKQLPEALSKAIRKRLEAIERSKGM